MKRLAGWVTVMLSVAGLACAQERGPRLKPRTFIPAPKVTNPGMRGPILRGARYEVKDASLVDLITTAWGIPRDRLQGGPAWLDLDRFDIVAKAPGRRSAGDGQFDAARRC